MTIPFEELIMIGWTKWDGGECPVAPGTLVRVRIAKGYEVTILAGGYNWNGGHCPSLAVKAYQVLELGRTVEGDPIIAGGVYETTLGELIIITGFLQFGDYRISGEIKYIGDIFLFNDKGRCAEDSAKNLMRLHRPKQTYTINIEREMVVVSKEQYDKIKDILEQQ